MFSYYILDGHTPVEVEITPDGELPDISMFTNPKTRRVAETYVGFQNDVYISTVFLGFDHSFSDDGPPVLFETMVFGGQLNEKQWRYCTWKEAEKGHARMVKLVKQWTHR